MKRNTKQREAVCAALATHDDFVSAQNLHDMLGDSAPSLATVYRTLQALAELGEIDSLVRGTETVYRACAADHHHHLVCVDCNAAVEIEADEVEAWAGRVSVAHGYELLGHVVELSGRCAGCQRNPRLH